MIKLKTTFIAVFLLTAILLASCAASSSPAEAVSAYWEAMVAKDKAQLSALSCSDYEAEALTTMESFGAFEPVLSNLECSVLETSGDSATVQCGGTIEVSYGAEVLKIDLSERNYAVEKESGDWRMCGTK
ncbi:MAG: hypothetical protein KBG10_03345 [Anaerolineaceae bacterium]|nr:hypothetical protein [Anaerolineaceae bacterium]